MRMILNAAAISALLALAPVALAHAQAMPATPDTATAGALPSNDIGTRSSLPKSPVASNITASDTHSTIAPTPPEPAAGPGANVQQLLASGNQALASGQTGTADEALEQAETKILTRTVPQSATDYSSQDPVVAQIEQARTAIGSHQNAQAAQVINAILASNAPELAD